MPQLARPLANSLLALLLSAVLGSSSSQAQAPTAPAVAAKKREISDRQICKAVTHLLNREHLTRHPLDDEISQRALKLFVKQLDPLKLYFYQADIEEFHRQANQLDDLTKIGDMSFANMVFGRLVQRVDERLRMIEEILTQPVDFTLNETMVKDPEKLEYAATPAEAYDRWRKRIKYDLLVIRSEKEETKINADPIDRLRRRYTGFAKRLKQTDGDELLEIFLTSVTTSYDPHTTFMSPSTLDNFNIVMRLGLDGIGVALQLVDGYTVVTKVLPGGAADKEGSVKEGDQLVSVGQATGEMVDIVDKKLNDIVSMVRGKTGTPVRLGVLKKGTNELKVVTIVRAAIKLTDSEARGQILEEGKKANGAPFRVGVIDLPSFYMDMEGARKGVVDFKSTTRDVRVIIDDFNRKGVDALVLDLRRNGGGSLTEAINLTGLFIEEGPVVQVKDPQGQVQHYDDMDRTMAWRGPLVVMTSKFSASASEIFAGAIQDYHRGIVVGDTSTHGKGTVQSLLELGNQIFGNANTMNLGALKITMQQFYRPNGDSTQKRGVLADIVLPSLSDHIEGISESDLDYAVNFDKVPANNYQKYNQVANEALTQLRARSAERVKQSPDFAKVARTIERYLEQKSKAEVTLNEKEYLAQRKDVDADKEEEKHYEESDGNKKPGEIIKRDFYMNEVLAVTVDYLQLLGQNTVARAN